MSNTDSTGAGTYNNLIRQTTYNYLHDLQNAIKSEHKQIVDPMNNDYEDVELQLLQKTNEAIKNWNAQCDDKADRIRKFRTLSNFQIAMILEYLHNACRIGASGSNASPDYDLIGIYIDNPLDKNQGTYITDIDAVNTLIRQYNHSATIKDENEIMAILRDITAHDNRRRFICSDEDLIAVNNGIFNYQTKVLEPFSPDRVFLSKSHTDYVPNAPNPVLHCDADNTDWDVESWFADLSDDPEIVQLLWEIVGAILRPNVSWDKSAWLYSEHGNNGKGTLCQLMRNLLGDGAYASIPLKDFSSDFMLEQLVSANAIIVDENDVGTYIDQAAKLKAVITNDVISINRKYKSPIVYRFHGFMVQCMNEFPKVKDRSDSFYRRQIFIPMEKRFQGKERKYIKHDYLNRQKVREYVLYRVLYKMDDYYELSEPQACIDILEQYKEYNDPVRQFFDEVQSRATWDLLPWTFLYDLFRAWFIKNVPNGKQVGRHMFQMQIRQLLDDSPVFSEAASAVRTNGRITGPELMIYDYKLENWCNPSNKLNPESYSTPVNLAVSYRGLIRTGKLESDITNINQSTGGVDDE